LFDGSSIENPPDEKPRSSTVSSVNLASPCMRSSFLPTRLHQDPACRTRLRKVVATFPRPNSTPSAKSVERFAVKRWAAVCGRPSASTACWTAHQPRIRATSTRDCRSCVPCARSDHPSALPSCPEGYTKIRRARLAFAKQLPPFNFRTPPKCQVRPTLCR